MSLLRCSFCGHRCLAGVNHVYWFVVEHGEAAHRLRQRLCDDCLAVNVLATLTPEDQEELTCAACGISVEDDVWPIYVTYYIKREGATRGAMALCEDHHTELKQRAFAGATELEDRYLDSTDTRLLEPIAPSDRVVRVGPPARPAPAVSAHQVFQAMGRVDPGPKHGS